MTFIGKIEKHGNGAMNLLEKSEMEELGVEIGASVRVTLDKPDEDYDQTRESARRMIGRWRRTLEKLGA